MQHAPIALDIWEQTEKQLVCITDEELAASQPSCQPFGPRLKGEACFCIRIVRPLYTIAQEIISCPPTQKVWARNLQAQTERESWSVLLSMMFEPVRAVRGRMGTLPIKSSD